MKKFIGIAIIILIIIGGVWYFGARERGGTPAGLATFVERNLPPEFEARLTAQIADMRAKIGDRVGDKKSMEDLERWIGLGAVHYTLGNLGEARAALLEAVDLNPVNYVAWGNLFDVLREMGDLVGAEQAMQKAMEVNADPYYTKYADFLREEYPERTEDFEDVLRAAIATKGQQPELISRLARFYMETGRYEEAVSHYEVLVGLLPNDLGSQRDLAAARAKLREQQEAGGE